MSDRKSVSDSNAVASLPVPDLERWQRAGRKLREHAPEAFNLAVAAFNAGKRADDRGERELVVLGQLAELEKRDPASFAEMVQLLARLVTEHCPEASHV